MVGRIHSLQSLGTKDGPGLRFVVFFAGCPLRCACCHNPDTWDMSAGTEISAHDLVQKALRYREYFGDQGGITLSGGEPLMQAAFAKEIFTLCKAQGVHTCLDTSGYRLDSEVKALLSVCDRVLLDLKYTEDEDYHRYVGISIQPVLDFLKYLCDVNIPTTIRQVVIPGINDQPEACERLAQLIRTHSCVDQLELLPFRKICQMKYDEMGKCFPFGHLPEADAEWVQDIENNMKIQLF